MASLKTTTIEPKVPLYLTIPNDESPDAATRWYMFVSFVYDRYTDAQILSELVAFTSGIERPRAAPMALGGLPRRGGVCMEILAPRGCSPSDVVLRLCAGLKTLQEVVADGSNGVELELLRSPVCGRDEPSYAFTGKILWDGK